MNLKDRLDSVWENEKLPRFSALDGNKMIEVCVIGGGIAGVSTAYQLAKRGHKVMLLEAFSLCSGQTSRTTAHLTTQLEEQFVHLLKLHDKETVSAFYHAHRTAIETIERNCELEGINCNFKRVNGYLFRGKDFSEVDLMKEQEAAASIGIELDYIEKTPLIVDSISSLKFSMQGQFNPVKYVGGLVRALIDLGVVIHEGTHVTGMVNNSPDITTISTDTGLEIQANFVVVATDTPISTRFGIHSKQFAYRTYAMAFKVAPQKEECLLWDTEDPYHYIRYVGDTLVIGGNDHRTGQSPSTDPFESLELWSRSKFPFVKEIKWKWSGQVFEPADQLAYIGKNPGHDDNIFVITGASGLGMTTGTIGSLLIPDLIEKKENPWASLFDPNRLVTSGLTDFVKENVNVAFQYRDWITPAEVKAEDDIPNDSGRLMREGLVKNCVYHDNSDNFEKKSAVCTHLGGIVHWNDIEKTWDCPCHGSRFNTQGQVIEGPAISGLGE